MYTLFFVFRAYRICRKLWVPIENLFHFAREVASVSPGLHGAEHKAFSVKPLPLDRTAGQEVALLSPLFSIKAQTEAGQALVVSGLQGPIGRNDHRVEEAFLSILLSH